MPQKLWTPGEEVVADDLNDYLQNQTVPQFASTSERDTEWPAPPEGGLCVIDDRLYQVVAGTWYTPFQRLARVTYSSHTTGIGTGGLDLTATSALATPGGRLIRIIGSILLTTSTGGGASMFPKTGSGSLTSLPRMAQLNSLPTGGAMLHGQITTVVSSTPTVFRLCLQAVANTVDIEGVSEPAWYEIWDAGAS
jgi:hypothetical protein